MQVISLSEAEQKVVNIINVSNGLLSKKAVGTSRKMVSKFWIFSLLYPVSSLVFRRESKVWEVLPCPSSLPSSQGAQHQPWSLENSQYLPVLTWVCPECSSSEFLVCFISGPLHWGKKSNRFQIYLSCVFRSCLNCGPLSFSCPLLQSDCPMLCV